MGDRETEPSVYEDVLQGLQEGIAWARGGKLLRVTRVELPAPPPAYTAEEIRAIRLKSGMSQTLFSRCLSISSKTLQAWEQGARRPSPMSSRFLQMIDLQPEILQIVSRGSAP